MGDITLILVQQVAHHRHLFFAKCFQYWLVCIRRGYCLQKSQDGADGRVIGRTAHLL